jgi:hypothetical protein
MGVKVYPRRVIDRANVTDRELGRLAGHVRGIRTSLGMLGNVGRLSLKGQAWDSARSYVEEVEMPYLNTKLQWIEAMKNGNARFRSEAQRLPGVNCLDKDLLEEEFDYWEDRLDREYDREHPRSSVISRCRRMIRDINSKLVAIDVFVQATGGIYDRAGVIQDILDRADTEIKEVSYNPQTNEIQFTSVSVICKKGLEQVDMMEAVKVTGLSEEQIREAMEYGFTVQEVCSAWTAVQNSKKKKWRHDVVELLYVAGKAEKLEPVDWKEVVHSYKENLQEIYEWIRQEKEKNIISEIGLLWNSSKDKVWDDVMEKIPGMNQYYISEDESASNYEHNKDLSIPDEAVYQGMIIDQGKMNEYKYGNDTSENNGCGWIATYNVLQVLENPQEAEDIIRSYEKNGVLLGGTLGTNPYGIGKLFEDFGYQVDYTVTSFTPEKVSGLLGGVKSSFNDDFSGDVNIVVYARNNWSAHYVTFVDAGDGKYQFYNDRYGGKEDIRTYEEFVKENNEMVTSMVISISK